jgi:phycobilisome rod-core linker protein
MSIPLLEYAPSSQNQRVTGYEIPSDEYLKRHSTETLIDANEMDSLIKAAYRQVFNEQQMTASSRQLTLESQLRTGQITVREFIRGLATSTVFRDRNFNTNSNYRFVQMCTQRLLGRDVYSDREKLAWSTVLATQGLQAFIDALLNSEEYLQNFGENIVPYQRRRILPQRTAGELPFARMARYDQHHRDTQPKQRRTSGLAQFERFDLNTFLQEINWSTVSALSIVGTGMIIFLLLVATVSNTGVTP